MSSESVQNIIRRAVQDAEFRGLLLHHPEQALAGADLTDAESAQLRRLTSASLESLAVDLKERDVRPEPGAPTTTSPDESKA